MKKISGDYFDNFDWSTYYKSKSNLVPRPTLLAAIELFKKDQKRYKQLFATDIGCGHGADSIELLKQGWKVLAIDNDNNGLSILKESIDIKLQRNLTTSKQSFEKIKLQKCNFLNASYCLPFCKPEYFERLWNRIENSVLAKGRFAGNFFGDKDSWANIKTMTFHKEINVRNLFSKFEIEYFHERDEDGLTATGEEKYWHVFSVVARKMN